MHVSNNKTPAKGQIRGCCPNDHLNPFEVAETSRGQMLNRGDRAASHAVAMSLNGKQRDVTEIERSVWIEAMMKATNSKQLQWPFNWMV